MTDSEIIKALECCASDTSGEACNGCPFNETKICDRDLYALEKYALSLINRQKVEIEKKDIEIDILIRKKEALNDEISDLRVEVEKLQQKYELSEAEREANVKGFTETLETVRAKAIKEFASKLTPRLLKEMDEQGLMPSAYVKKVHAYAEIELFINEIVKEMTENQ